MGILYALVARTRGGVVLAEFSATQTNANTIARQILGKLPLESNDSNSSYCLDRHIFHVKRADRLAVVCMADDSVGRTVPFAFLKDIHQRFLRNYGHAIHSASAYAMNDSFSRVLNQHMEYYSNDRNADRINRLKGEMSHVGSVMIDNIDKVLERGDHLSLLVEKTSTLQGNTIRFKRQSRRYRSSVCRASYKLMLTWIILILIIFYAVLAYICHGPLLPSCLN